MRKRKPIFTPGHIALMLIFLVIAILAIKYWNVTIDKQRLFSLSMLSLMCGSLYESFRVTEKWIYIPYIFLGALAISCLWFLPGKNDHGPYIFSEKLLYWPYAFAVAFIFISAVVYQQKMVTKLSEDITLIQSISIIYWVISYGFISQAGWVIKILLGLGLLFAAFSIFNALTYITLGRTTRLWLSIWSSIIMLLFSVDNIFRVLSNDAIEVTEHLSEKAFIALQYFLLGVSSMYIAQNIIMLIGFLPEKGSSMAKYRADLREIKDMHIDRYSEEQSYIGHSILSILITSSLYGLNYRYNFLPPQTAIMVGFVLFPCCLYISRVTRHIKLQRQAHR